MSLKWLILMVFVSIINLTRGDSEYFSIEGKISPPFDKKQSSTLNNEWVSLTQVLINGGEHIGFLKEDGTFIINGVPAGSYIIDVVNPSINYDSARVDITSKGKIRARKVNNIQPALVTQIPYPLKMIPLGPYRYFQAREQWRITDVLLSPMVLMMVLPLLLIVVLPKMMSDPETRKEMENLPNMANMKYEMPEMSEMLTSFFGGGKSDGDHDKKQKSIKSKKNN